VNIQTKGNTSQALSAIKLYLPPNGINTTQVSNILLKGVICYSDWWNAIQVKYFR